jgi:hypothetical protein
MDCVEFVDQVDIDNNLAHNHRHRPCEEGKDPVDVLKAVGEIGKGFVRSVYSLKSPRIMN